MSVLLQTERRVKSGKRQDSPKVRESFTKEELDDGLEVDPELVRFIKTVIRPQLCAELYGMKYNKAKEKNRANYAEHTHQRQ